MVFIKNLLLALLYTGITVQGAVKAHVESGPSSSKLPESANTKVKGTSSESASGPTSASAKEPTTIHAASTNSTAKANVAAPIRFIGWPHAVTSCTATEALTIKGSPNDRALSNDATEVKITELHYTAGVQNNGAQILYRKMVPAGDPTISLVSVVLHNADLPAGKTAVAVLYDKQFDMMTQSCSCYWINAPDVVQAVPNLQASEKYFIQFVDMLNPTPKVNVRSGFFAIKP